MLYFWNDRVPWGIRVLVWALFVGAIFGLGWLFPEWGNYNDLALFCFVPILILNLCFGTEGEKGVEIGWKFSAFALTAMSIFYEPYSPFGSGTKLACSFVVILTLVYTIFGHTLLQKWSVGGIVYDILFWLCVLAGWILGNFVTALPLYYKLITNSGSTYYIPYEIALFVIAGLRFGPLYNIIERIIKGPSYVPARAGSVKTDDRSCKNCTYYRIREGQGYATYPYCLKHKRDIGALEVYSKCGDYERR